MSRSRLLTVLLPALLVVGGVIFFALQGSSGSGGTDAITATPLAGDAEAGRALYAQKCASCHGQAGAGGRSRALVPAGASLRGSDEADFTENLVQIITHGKGRMPAWGDTRRLTPQQIADVTAYILGLNP